MLFIHVSVCPGASQHLAWTMLSRILVRPGTSQNQAWPMHILVRPGANLAPWDPVQPEIAANTSIGLYPAPRDPVQPDIAANTNIMVYSAPWDPVRPGIAANTSRVHFGCELRLPEVVLVQ